MTLIAVSKITAPVCITVLHSLTGMDISAPARMVSKYRQLIASLASVSMNSIKSLKPDNSGYCLAYVYAMVWFS